MSILATAEAVLTNRQKQLGCAVLNIGGSTTSLAVYEEGDVMHTAILPLGSEHITSDIAIGLRVSIDVAEKIKVEYGSVLPKAINKRDDINLGEISGGENFFISRKYIAEIIEARVEEIFTRVDNELKKIDRSGMLPAGMVLTGGGSKLEGIVEAAKNLLKLPASLGYPLDITSTTEKINDITYSTSVGLVLWGLQMSQHKSDGWGKVLNQFKLTDLTKRFKKFFKSFTSSQK
jgi:cell division protein FtsA